MNVQQRAAAIMLLPQIRKLDCMQFARAYKEAYGEYIDHHEFAYLLDDLHRKGIVRIVQPGGFTVYKLVNDEVTLQEVAR